MASGKWASSGRRAELPPDWDKIRQQVFQRDGHRCTAILPSGKRCPRGRMTGHSIECDHIGDRLDHRIEALATKCSHHHMKKTQGEALEGRTKRQGPKRPSEEHPGRIRRPD